MKIDVSAKTYEPKWVKYKDCELFLEPYPVGRTDLVMSADLKMTISGEQRKDMFLYSVQDWKNIIDSNGIAIPCTEKNKQIVFDYGLGDIPSFIYRYNSEFDTSVKEEFSNLQNGQDGILIEKVKPAETAEEQ